MNYQQEAALNLNNAFMCYKGQRGQRSETGAVLHTSFPDNNMTWQVSAPLATQLGIPTYPIARGCHEDQIPPEPSLVPLKMPCSS